METVIDWSKKPEGATHYAPAGDEVAFRWFNMDKGDFGASWIYGYWDLLDRPSNRHDMVKIEQPWTGEGLPPVGIKVHIHDPEGELMYGAGESGEVIAHVENTAVVRMSYGLGCFVSRHLRTPKQIAAEERDKAIAEIREIASAAAGRIEGDAAAAVYDAGYRKQVTP